MVAYHSILRRGSRAALNSLAAVQTGFGKPCSYSSVPNVMVSGCRVFCRSCFIVLSALFANRSFLKGLSSSLRRLSLSLSLLLLLLLLLLLRRRLSR
jgi:hypothetical protein